MEPYARVRSGGITDEQQVWGDPDLGSLLLLRVPLDHIVDLTPDGIGIDVAGPGVVLSHVPSSPTGIESVLRMEAESELDWSPIRYYSKPALVDSSLGPTPEKSVTVSLDSKGRFYLFLSRNATSDILDAYSDLLRQRGFVTSAARSRTRVIVMRAAIIGLLLSILILLIVSSISRLAR